jgi:hypothetical protein
MARNGKLANPFTLYYSLYMLIIQVYHDSGCMRNFGRMPDSGQKMRLLSYVPLRSEDMTPIVHPNSGHTS